MSVYRRSVSVTVSAIKLCQFSLCYTECITEKISKNIQQCCIFLLIFFVMHSVYISSFLPSDPLFCPPLANFWLRSCLSRPKWRAYQVIFQNVTPESEENWAAWLLPGGPIDPPARWAARSNVKIVERRTRITGEGRNGGERKEQGTKSQRGGEGRKEWNGGVERKKRDQRPLARDVKLYLDICAATPEFLVMRHC